MLLPLHHCRPKFDIRGNVPGVFGNCMGACKHGRMRAIGVLVDRNTMQIWMDGSGMLSEAPSCRHRGDA